MDDVHEFNAGAAVVGLMREAHHFVLSLHYPAGEVGLGVEEADELVVGTHECLVVAIDEEVVEDH